MIIDRFEENLVVCEREDGKIVNIERSTIPQDAKEGDVLVLDGNRIFIDQEETLKRKKKIEKIMKDLWES
jgi:RNase P/RNase MRP subunit p29